MKKRLFYRQGWIILTAAMIALSTGFLPAVQPAFAGELDKIDSSLKLIPADAAIYTSTLRNREQIDAFLKSNAYAKLKAMPSVQMGLALYDAQAKQENSPVAQIEKVRQNPETKKLINLAIDMASNDIFVYGDKNCTDFVKLMQYIVSGMRYGPAILEATGENQGLRGDQLQAKVFVETLIEHLDLVKVPDMVIGFHLKKPSAANEALIKLEMALNLAIEAIPELKGHLNRETIGETEDFLVLRLDGKMIKSKDMPLKELNKIVKDEAKAQKLIDHLKNMELVVVMGVREKDLLISIGSSVDCIKKLGTGERLIDRAEFKPLEKFADKPLTSIGYISKAFNEQINNNAQNIDDLRDFLVQMLPLAKLTDEQSNQVSKDIETLAAELKGTLPEMGAIMAFSFLTDNGGEGYQYAWGTHPNLDGSKPLELLNHLGGNPILAVVGRGKAKPDQYENMTKWAKVGWKYMEELALPRVPEKDREQVVSVLKDVKPLLERLNTTLHDMLLPALADGQIGLVVDAKLKSKQFVRTMPEMDKEMPMVEPALIFGVSDAALLRKAMAELHAIGNDAIVLVRKYNHEVPADFILPEAKVSQITGGSIFSYPLPEACGVDKNIVPNAGLSDKVAVLSMSPQQTEMLLSTVPLKVGGVLSKTDRPLAVAACFNWAEFVGALTPWINYVLEQHLSDQQLGGQKEIVISQVNTVLEVLSTVKCATSETYLEGDCLVSHSMLEVRDVSK